MSQTSKAPIYLYKLLSFLSLYPMRFFVETWHTKSQCPILEEEVSASAPPTQMPIIVVLLHTRVFVQSFFPLNCEGISDF